MSKGSRSRWSLTKALTDRIDARIDKALATFAFRTEIRDRQLMDEKLAGVRAELLDLSHRIEARAQLATAESVNQAERNIAYGLEVHSRVIRTELQGLIMREAEARGQTAGLEAKAYSDAGLFALSRAIAGTNRVIAQLSRRLGELEQKNADALHRLQVLDGIGTLPSENRGRDADNEGREGSMPSDEVVTRQETPSELLAALFLKHDQAPSSDDADSDGSTIAEQGGTA